MICCLAMHENTQLTTLLLCIFAALGVSCSSSNWLEGTISKELSLEFDRVEAAFFGCTLRIEYKTERQFGTTVPCGLSIDSETVEVGELLDGQEFIDAVDVYRAAPYGGALPEGKSGWILIDEFQLDSGKPIQGEFRARLEKGNFDDEYDLSGGFGEDLREPDPGLKCD